MGDGDNNVAESAKDGPSLEQQEQLLRAVVASRQFAHADNLKRILRYLVERWREDPTVSAKEYDIAIRALGRAETFDSRLDPIVRVSMGVMRERLFAYFATEGRESAWRLEVPKGQYILRFTPNTVSRQQEELSLRPTARFWHPYFQCTAPNMIVYTEPLFFRDGSGRYFRDWFINSVADGKQRIRESYGVPADRELEPVYHYISAGEMHSLLSLTGMFHEAGVPVETRNSRNSHWTELSRCNLILLGSPRTNAFLRQMQGDAPMVVEEDRIVVLGSQGEATRTIRGKRFRQGELLRMTEYAVVTVRPGILPRSTITMIAANHGRAIEGAARNLTLEDRVEDLFRALGVQGAAPVPRFFQLLLRVETVDIDDEVASVTLEECLVIPPPNRP